MIIDFHSHFLHNIDDGSRNLTESIAMLKESYRQGVDVMVATPHFRLGDHNINSFLEERQQRLDEIMDALTEEDKKRIPKIVLGAEVEYMSKMRQWDYLDKLTLADTKYIMLEMPFVYWTDAMLNTIEYICNNTDLKPLIPHIDRYFLLFIEPEKFQRLYNMDVYIMLNAIYVNNPNNIEHTRELIESGTVHLLTSDCHGIEWRPPNLGTARKVIAEQIGEQYLHRMDTLGEKILNNL